MTGQDFLDFGSQTDFPKRFLAQVEGTSHNIVGQDAIKEHSSNIWSQYYLIYSEIVWKKNLLCFHDFLFIICLFFIFIDVVMDMKVHFVINVSDIQDANMANVMNLGLAIVKKAGVAFFATKI